MNASELKSAVESSGHSPYFFTPKTMRCFGDRMSNYVVRRVTVLALFDAEGNYHEEGKPREAYELYRRRPVKHGLKSSAYFATDTFAQIHSIKVQP